MLTILNICYKILTSNKYLTRAVELLDSRQLISSQFRTHGDSGLGCYRMCSHIYIFIEDRQAQPGLKTITRLLYLESKASRGLKKVKHKIQFDSI